LTRSRRDRQQYERAAKGAARVDEDEAAFVAGNAEWKEITDGNVVPESMERMEKLFGKGGGVRLRRQSRRGVVPTDSESRGLCWIDRQPKLVRRLFVVAAVCLIALITLPVMIPEPLSQLLQRTMAPNASHVVRRQWPVSGAWQAVLRRGPHGISCVLATGLAKATDAYVWGFAKHPDGEWGLVIGDKRHDATDGDYIRVVVDNVAVGTFPVTETREIDGTKGIRSAITIAQYDRLSTLLAVSGSIRFETANATYSAALANARPAFYNWNDCRAEMDGLNKEGGQP
jgi:hypothetical protein